MGRPEHSGNGQSEQPAWMTETGRHRLNDFMHEQALEVLRARVPRWSPGAAIAAVVGLLGIFGAIGAGAVAVDRTKEVPALRSEVARHSTAIEVNAEAHRAILENQDRQSRALDRLERHFGTKPAVYKDDP